MNDPLLSARGMRRALQPNWNVHGPWQWGTIASLATGPPPTLGVNLDGASSVTSGIRYLSSYTPRVGDTVLVARMQSASRGVRVVMGPLAPNGAPVAGRCYANATTTLASATVTQISSLVQDFADGGVTLSGNALTVPVTGLYQASASLGWAAVGGGVAPTAAYVTEIRVNGTGVREAISYVAAAVTNPTLPICDTISLNANDAVTLYGAQYSGGNAITQAGTMFSWLSVALL